MLCLRIFFFFFLFYQLALSEPSAFSLQSITPTHCSNAACIRSNKSYKQLWEVQILRLNLTLGTDSRPVVLYSVHIYLFQPRLKVIMFVKGIVLLTGFANAVQCVCTPWFALDANTTSGYACSTHFSEIV